jgi:hypothetical protein
LIKTIVKLLIALVVINAAVRGGMAMWKYYQFKDAAQQLVIFGVKETPTQLHNEVLARAQDLDVPIAPENVNIRREGARTWADAKYTEQVELFPRYRYPIEFSFSVEGFNAVAAVK